MKVEFTNRAVRDLRDIFEVQSDIARNVTDELGVALGASATPFGISQSRDTTRTSPFRVIW